MSYRVLVVDDTNFMRKMAADCLKQQGYTVAGEAANGKEAIRLYEELRPDIVLMDLTMPEMNGVDAIKEILKINPDAVILICSASNQQDMIFVALEAGAKGFLKKPFNPERLYETIRTYAEPHLSAAHAAELETQDETDAEDENPPAAQEEITEPVDQLENEIAMPTEAANTFAMPAVAANTSRDAEPVITPAKRNERARSFTSGYVCSWQEEINGETANYTVIYTTNDDKVLIELSRPNQQKQSIPFPLSGFRELTDWLEDHMAGRTASVK